MKCIPKTTLLPLLRREGFDGLQVEVVIKVQEVQIFPVNQKIEHVVALPADLKTGFDPIKLRQLKEFGLLKGTEKISFVLCLGTPVVQTI